MNVGKSVRSIATHCKCRNGIYPKTTNVRRFNVPDDKVSWSTEWDEYRPTEYTSAAILNAPWADPALKENCFLPEWNSLDGLIDRRSHVMRYEIRNGAPINPIGRTGLTGRGCLGRWGPNHAADPIVTRWKRSESGEVIKNDINQKPILQFVAIERKCGNEWAIPGGMVDPGEQVSVTLKREFAEEALNYLDASEDEKSKWQTLLEGFFSNGLELYRGYVDDPRNTDNAWMETIATNFHDEDGTSVGRLKLAAGDDAVNVKWMDVHSHLNLYANHSQFIHMVALKRNSFW